MIPDIFPQIGGVKFSAAEQEALVSLRDRVRSGQVGEDGTLEHRRLEFARWLVDHGRINEGAPW